jgi:outer membrane protein assembly factor BamB
MISKLMRFFCVTVTLMLLASTANAQSNWPRWRGPTADGHATEQGLPTQWDESSVQWKTALPGLGHSSPIVWGKRVFLTSALDEGRQRVVFCVDRDDGRILWQQVAWTGEPEPSHEVNGFASATCVTDGERVYAFFGRGGLHCYTVDGEHVWSRDLGPFTGPWGTAASPVLVGELLVQNCDADADARIVALDKRSGETVWSTPRDSVRSWSTPVLVRAGERRELVVNGHTGVRAYAPETGEELWFCKSFDGRGTPTVTPAGGLLHVLNGLQADIYAIRPGGTGDVTATHMAWHTPRRSRDIASPIVVGDFVLVVSLRGGILSCYDAPTGKQLWSARTDTPENFSASPVAYDGLAFFTSETGVTLAVKPGPELNVVAHNTVGGSEDEIFRASLAPVAGRVFIRSDRVLYCVGRAEESK